jgi:prophage antirepressor-like protein
MFAYKSQQLRGVMLDGQPWFHATDVCRILGLTTQGGTHMHTVRLEADERKLLRKGTNNNSFGVSQLLGTASMATVVSRPGLFKLIQRSNKPEAKAFDRWVRHEVLPQVMDNGGYMTRDADAVAVAEAAPANAARTDLDLMKTVMSAMQAMQARIETLEVEATEAAPKVAFVDTYVAARGTLSFADVSRTLGAGNVSQFCALLRESKVLFKNARGENVAYKEHLDAGRFEQKTLMFNNTVRLQTRVTPAGVEWLAEQLPKFLGKQVERAEREARNVARRAAARAALG